MKKFRVNPLGIPIKIVSDCEAFSLTMSKKDICIRVARWALLLEEFNYVIQHRPGKNMQHVDALSRPPTSVLLIKEDKSNFIEQLKKLNKKILK